MRNENKCILMITLPSLDLVTIDFTGVKTTPSVRSTTVSDHQIFSDNLLVNNLLLDVGILTCL